MSTQRTAIYVVVSICVVSLGVACLAWAENNLVLLSVATSLIAGGISSAAFGIIRYFDEKTNIATSAQFGKHLEDLRSDLQDVGKDLQVVRSITAVARDVNERRVFDRHPDDEIRAEIERHRRTSRVTLEVMGLSLRPFYGDFMSYLIERGNVNLRLIVQEPGTELFSTICQQEARDEAAMARDVLLVTRRVLDYQLESNPGNSEIEVRWFRFCPAVSLTRVDGVVFVRSRFLQEALHPPMFFERYYEIEGRCFDAYKSYFEKAWEFGLKPNKQLCDDVEAKLRVR